MDVSFHQSQSPTKLFNQSMFIEETVATSVTNCKIVDMSMVANKRKTIETISVDEAITNVTKSVKIRKMNDENLEPENRNNTILQNVKININISSSDSNSGPLSNLNTTRICDADLSMDDTPHNKVCREPKYSFNLIFDFLSLDSLTVSYSLSIIENFLFLR